MHIGIFITGTDTGVGKTRFCSLLVSSLRSKGIDAVGMKPFCCGDRFDAESLLKASGSTVDMALVNPVWLQVPAAPYSACLVENRTLDIDTARSAFDTLARTHQFVVVEGVGGWRVPLTDQICMSDFATSLNLPVLVVSANRLGALNHTQLTVDSIQSRGSECCGVVLNNPADEQQDPANITNLGVLELILNVPVLGELSFGADEIPQRLLQKLQSRRLIPPLPN
jgi:dethiobiotin synthetase